MRGGLLSAGESLKRNPISSRNLILSFHWLRLIVSCLISNYKLSCILYAYVSQNILWVAVFHFIKNYTQLIISQIYVFPIFLYFLLILTAICCGCRLGCCLRNGIGCRGSTILCRLGPFLLNWQSCNLIFIKKYWMFLIKQNRISTKWKYALMIELIKDFVKIVWNRKSKKNLI
jgi:hypothetical protein